MPSKHPKLIYLDHAATTPVDPQVLKAMLPYFSVKYGNPSSLYKQGMEAKKAIDMARKSVADILGARSNEILFTAGGTESINLAIFGLTKNFKITAKKKPHVITSKIEHHAVLHSMQALQAQGFEVTYINVDDKGFVKLDELKKAVRPETILVSIMYANNEIGTIEPIAEIGAWLKKINQLRIKDKGSRILFHTDACQAAGSLDLNVNKLGVDMLSANGSKIYGPKQTGFLYVRSGVQLQPIIYGGGQEKNLRSGTENVAGIVGLARALELAQKGRTKENQRLRALRNYLINQILSTIPNAELNGPGIEKDTEQNPLRLPNNANFSFHGIEGEALMLYLDAKGIAVSTGSACTTANPNPSHVILATGKGKKYAESSIRFTLGKTNNRNEITEVIKTLVALLPQLNIK